MDTVLLKSELFETNEARNGKVLNGLLELTDIGRFGLLLGDCSLDELIISFALVD